MPTDTPARLRSRAASLRNAAATLPGWEVTNLLAWAGPDCWVGPSPTACLQDLELRRADLIGVRERLLTTARSLEHQAAVAEAAALPPVSRS